MKPTETELEQLLRAAPAPRPPQGLKETLMQTIPRTPRPTPAPAPRPNGFRLRDWWPVLATAAIAIACLVAVAVQQGELQELRQLVDTLQQEQANAKATAEAAAAASGDRTAVVVSNTRQDLDRLRTTARTLADEVGSLESLRAENESLRQQAAAGGGLAPEEIQPMLDARDKARSISCVNNLKQLGLAARIWATDNGDILPPDLLSMSNEIVAPKILVCPADEGRQPAADWSGFTLANTSYEFLAASGTETEPQRVAFRCPLHGHVGLADGSVQQSVAKTHPEYFVTRDGKLFLEGPAASGPVGGAVRMDPAMAARYGLAPGAPPTPGGTPAPPAGAIQMDPRMAARYGLSTGGVTTVEGQPMSEELMRRYGLLPADAAGQSTPVAPEPAP